MPSCFSKSPITQPDRLQKWDGICFLQQLTSELFLGDTNKHKRRHPPRGSFLASPFKIWWNASPAWSGWGNSIACLIEGFARRFCFMCITSVSMNVRTLSSFITFFWKIWDSVCGGQDNVVWNDHREGGMQPKTTASISLGLHGTQTQWVQAEHRPLPTFWASGWALGWDVRQRVVLEIHPTKQMVRCTENFSRIHNKVRLTIL